MAGDRTIFDEPHHQSLELLAANALAEGDIATAFKLADRRCRILPTPEAHCYLLRGEAFYRLGDKAAAVVDVANAVEIAPDDVAANRRMLAWGDGAQQLQAALSLIRHDHNIKSVQDAAKVLVDNGRRNFGNVIVFEDHLEGWAVWEAKSSLSIAIDDGTNEIEQECEANAFHPLAQYGYAAGFRIKRPKSISPQRVSLSAGGTVLFSTRAAGNDGAVNVPVILPKTSKTDERRVTVIVPIYADFEATRLCLGTLLEALKLSHQSAILIDDATPEPRLAEYLAKLATDPRLELLVNVRNLGFIGSVNRALERITSGDVIILNADTIVPRDFINGLAAAARSSADIGTVTPLSNNGEFTSFPIPFRSNPLGSLNDVGRINAIAAKVNAGKIVDIPSGIGFCLYVTRACLDQVGPLSEHFERGYLEDVDLCLRSRELGLRNVCAPSVYVGHAGSKSFGTEKRSLVIRNLRVLELRFPYHRPECTAFMEADPLRPARQAIEQLAASVASNPRLLVTGPGSVGAIAKERARRIASAAETAMILEVHHLPDGPAVKVVNASRAMPQSLQFGLSEAHQQKSLLALLKSNKPSRIEFLDPTNTPQHLVDLLLALKVPYDLFIADAGLRGQYDREFCASATHHVGPSQPSATGANAHSAVSKNWMAHWQKMAAGAEKILAPTPEAEAFASSILPSLKIAKAYELSTKPQRARRKRGKAGPPHLGFVPVRSCANEQRLMCETARRLFAKRPDVTVTVLGETLDDIDLMRSTPTFVTGMIEPAEFERIVAALGINHLLICTTRPIFGHPILSCASSTRLPIACFDWPGSGSVRRDDDLLLDPHGALDDLIIALDGWMPKSGARQTQGGRL
jgi:O-antigen biosynthesis protein